MSLETLDWLRGMKAIEHEYRVARLAMRNLDVLARHDPTILDPDMRVRGIRSAIDNLGNTYAIRLFAEFETSLRLFWGTTRNEPEPRSIAEIIDRIAARHRIGHDELANAHRARQFRNRQVHRNEEDGETIAVEDYRGYLCSFLSKMPLNWAPPT